MLARAAVRKGIVTPNPLPSFGCPATAEPAPAAPREEAVAA